MPKTSEAENAEEKNGKSDSTLIKDGKNTLKSEPVIKEEPMTPVRRSGRAPVPSSRFKDMEVMTPSRKRSSTSISNCNIILII